MNIFPKNSIPAKITDNPTNNIILTQTERLTMNSRVSNWRYNRNKNIIVVGGSGSGKTRFFVKPNLMQMHSKTKEREHQKQRSSKQLER